MTNRDRAYLALVINTAALLVVTNAVPALVGITSVWMVLFIVAEWRNS